MTGTLLTIMEAFRVAGSNGGKLVLLGTVSGNILAWGKCEMNHSAVSTAAGGSSGSDSRTVEPVASRNE